MGIVGVEREPVLVLAVLGSLVSVPIDSAETAGPAEGCSCLAEAEWDCSQVVPLRSGAQSFLSS